MTEFKQTAEKFMQELPYRKEPYCSRNWGHAWHSLCSYHGKLKPSIAHFLVERFTKKGDTVLDSLCGVGTIPFEACMQGRIGIGNDLSELSFVVSKAKLEKPTYRESIKVIKELNIYIEANKGKYKGSYYENFGMNGVLPDYFEEKTYEEILIARQYFISKLYNITSAEALVYSALLHVLHGNRPYALSRHSHSLTPYSPTGDFVYKNVIEHITNKVELSYAKDNMPEYVKGRAIIGNYNDLKDINADIIICSPPFADSLDFCRTNWMRLWMCGWEPENYKSSSEKFLDNTQKNNFDVYKSFFEICSNNLKDNGKMILHLGKTTKTDMAKELSERAESYFDIIYSADETVTDIEKHGVTDKGGTIAHQFLFLQKK